MNANEVIADRALEILGHPRGRYEVIHPLDHVHLDHSTNDVYSTAVRLALVTSLRRLGDSPGALATAFAGKAEEFGDVLKMGRTQLQEAVPMTLGQEFTTYAVMIEEDRQRLTEAAALLLESNLGRTAIGTFVQLSGVLTRVAVRLAKACDDLRLTSSGPTAGLGEINLPPVQAGSSIMPGKVNR